MFNFILSYLCCLLLKIFLSVKFARSAALFLFLASWRHGGSIM